MNFIIDSPTTDVCDEDLNHAVGILGSENLKVPYLQKLNPMRIGCFQKSWKSIRVQGTQNQEGNVFQSGIHLQNLISRPKDVIQKNPSTLGLTGSSTQHQLKKPVGLTNSQQTNSDLASSGIQPKKSIQSFRPSLRPVFQLPQNPKGDTDLHQSGKEPADPTSITYCQGGSLPTNLVGPSRGVGKLGLLSVDDKMCSHNRRILGPGASKFLKEVNLPTPQLSSVTENGKLDTHLGKDIAQPAQDPLRLFHPRIHTIVVGETPSVIEPIKYSTGALKEKTLTLSSRPRITVIKTSSNNFLAPLSSAVLPQGNLSESISGASNAEFSQQMMKPSSGEQFPSAHFGPLSTQNLNASPTLKLSRERLASDNLVSSPTKESNLFLKSVPNFDEVALSPTNAFANRPLDSPEAESPLLPVPVKKKLQIDSNQYLEDCLKYNS